MVERINSPTKAITDQWKLQPDSENMGQSIMTQLNLLAEVVFMPRLEDAIHKILEVGNEVCGASLLIVYLAENQQPMLRRRASRGCSVLLPDSLPAQELINLHKPQLWLSGRRPHSILQRAALTANLSYLASAPLGQNHAAIGLLVVCGEEPPEGKDLLFITGLLAQSLTVAIQHQFLRKQTQSNQKNNQNQLNISEVIEENSREGIIVLSPELNIHRMNHSAEIMLGYNSREIAGQPAEHVLIGSETLDLALSLAQQCKPTINYDGEHSLGNVRLYRRSGEDFLAQARVYPLAEAGNVQQILVFLQDLSEQEQIKKQAQHLEQRALLGEVTAAFAHEVRNPVNNISTGLQLLAMNLPENDPNQETIEGMLQDCDRLAELLKGVLAFSRPTEYAMEQLDLGNTVSRLLERLHSRITRMNVEYNLIMEPDCPPILGNLRAIEQVFNNLINNALQAMGELGGLLVIKIQQNQENEGQKYVEVSVADTGRGIPSELQERIFQPFFTTEQNGTGLGLAITKRIVTAHKGNIRLESFPGGTVFHVQLPAVNPNNEVT